MADRRPHSVPEEPAGDGRSGSGLPWVLCAVLLGWALVAWRSAPPAPLGPGAPPEVFSADRAFATLERVLEGGAPHPSGSPAHAQVLDAIRAECAALGLPVELQRTLVPGHGRVAVVRNLLVRIDGTGPASEPAVMLVAHTDSVRAGPGAADDGAGVAALLETARALLAFLRSL